MENTSKILFEDEAPPSWYVAVADAWIGPLTASDLYEKIQARELSWAHFIWRKGGTAWRRACEHEVFAAAVPAVPASELQEKVRRAASAVVTGGAIPPRPPRFSPEDRTWFLHYNDAQFGPFSPEEIGRFLQIGKIHGRVFAWRDGMPTWERIERIDAFAKALDEARKRGEDTGRPAKVEKSLAKSASDQTSVPPTPQAKTEPQPAAQAGAQEQRKAPRRPLVARILLINERDSAVNVAMCRDVSVGGMQVLTDRLPGPVNTRIKLNVSPAGETTSIPPFVAEGVIVRLLEDGRGFSFRFEKLPSEARSAIEKYISTD